MRAVERELRAKQDMSMAELYGFRAKRRLSKNARVVLRDAALYITGMHCGPNDYWLAEEFSEAIEAAEALGL